MTHMIRMAISEYNLGDENSADDNQRYADAVRAAIESEYPGSDVEVWIHSGSIANETSVSDDVYGDVEARCNEIANDVWGRAGY